MRARPTFENSHGAAQSARIYGPLEHSPFQEPSFPNLQPRTDVVQRTFASFYISSAVRLHCSGTKCEHFSVAAITRLASDRGAASTQGVAGQFIPIFLTSPTPSEPVKRQHYRPGAHPYLRFPQLTACQTAPARAILWFRPRLLRTR